MAGASIRIEFDDARIRAALQRLIDVGQHPREAMQDIATLGENSTRERFHTETGPDGKRWTPIKQIGFRKKQLRKDGRIRKSAINYVLGRKILTKDGHLGDSLGSRAGATFAEWGVNRIYAAIHQFGGQAGRGLRSKIVARPYLGINAGDEADILDILQRRIEAAAAAS